MQMSLNEKKKMKMRHRKEKQMLHAIKRNREIRRLLSNTDTLQSKEYNNNKLKNEQNN